MTTPPWLLNRDRGEGVGARPVAPVRRPPRGGLLAVVILLGSMIGGGSARAYVRARTPDTFVPLFWRDPTKAFEVARPPDGLGVTEDDLRGAAAAAAMAWSYPTLSCTGVNVRLARESTDSQVAARDGVNRIIMRTDSWCRDPVAMTHCHDPAAVAVTTVFSRARPGTDQDGELVEADIEINAAGDFFWGVLPEGPLSGRDYANVYDLTSALTHETGHFIGLDHNCLVRNAPLLVDDQGQPTPDCDNVPADEQSFIEDATMYPFMDPTDLSLRTLTDDDVRAACEIYPYWSVPDYEWIGAGGCSQAPERPRAPAAELAATALCFAAGILFSCLSRRRGMARGPRNPAPRPRNRRLM